MKHLIKEFPGIHRDLWSAERCHQSQSCHSPDMLQKPSLHFLMNLIPLGHVYECDVLSSHPTHIFQYS